MFKMFGGRYLTKWMPVLFVLQVLSVVSSYPKGATIDTCMTMFPKHKGTQTQLERDVYGVSTDTVTYMPNQRIKISISSTRGELIKGVQVRAHRTEINTEEILGTYENLLPADKLLYVGCQGRQNNMVTHANNASVPMVQMTWVAPGMNVGPIIFEVTVVQSYYIFYHGLKSSVIKPSSNSPPIVYPATSTPVVSKTLLPLDWKECGESKGCLLYPRYCKGNNCKAAVSFLVDASNDTITFELMVQGAQYVSLGFSRDMTMGDDQTVSCCSVYDRVNIVHGWNHPLKFNVQDVKSNLSNLEATSSQDGNIYCRFTRPLIMDMSVTYSRVDPSTPVTLSFDLRQQHYLFIAWGDTYEGTDILGYHYQMPVISETKVDFFDYSVYKGSVMPKLIRAHSTMMAVAWMGFAGLSIIMARYYKDGFNEKTICGTKVWFHIHRISAILTFTLTVAGIVVVLVKLDGNITKKASARTHMCLGFTVVAVVCGQVLSGFLRPSPGHRFRPVFNFIHRLLGTAALIIAAAALICAYKIADFSYDMQSFGERTVAVWAGIFVFLEIILTGYKYFVSTLCVHTSRSDEYDLDKESRGCERKDVPPSLVLLSIFLIFIACSITAAFCMTLFF